MDKLNHFLSIDIYSASELAVKGTRYFNEVWAKGLLFIAIHGGVCALKQNNFLAQHDIGCSIGSAIYQQGDTEHSLFKRADAAMYRNKK